jgi:hypothetical protein
MAKSNIRILAVPAAEKDVNKKEKGKGIRNQQRIYSQKNIIYKEVLTI